MDPRLNTQKHFVALFHGDHGQHTKYAQTIVQSTPSTLGSFVSIHVGIGTEVFPRGVVEELDAYRARLRLENAPTAKSKTRSDIYSVVERPKHLILRPTRAFVELEKSVRRV